MPTASPSFGSLLVALGESDCETVDSGSLVQPINAITSLAFSVVGLALAGWAGAAQGRERWIRWAFVAAMVSTGIGSFLYHGPQPAGSGFVHDITFLTALLILVTADAAAARRWSDHMVIAVLIASVLVVSALLLLSPDITNVITGVLVVLLVVSDILLFGRGGRGTPWYLAAVGFLVLALVANAFGRTGSPLCDPMSPFQLHGAWHVLSAAALGCYAVATGAVRSARQATSPTAAER